MDCEIVIVGGGIAGLSAALSAARLGRTVAIFTGGLPGGELLGIELVDGVPGQEHGIPGYDLCPIVQEQAAAAGAQFLIDRAETITPVADGWSVTGDGTTVAARALILAMGARLRKLGVPGEAELTGLGVSHCATCDGPLLRGKVAIVAGGGDSGMQEALTLAAHCSKVIVAERNSNLGGQAAYRDAVMANPKIEVLSGHQVIAIEGTGKVERVVLRSADGSEHRIEAAGLFALPGLTPDTALVGGLVELASDGRIAVDQALRTSAKGVFAAGNLRHGNAWRAAGAMGDGATAAMSATLYLDSGAWR